MTATSDDLTRRCRDLMLELGLAGAEDAVAARPLTGGVASDIARVDVGAERYCVKFALEKLRVEADWHAPVHRNRAEYEWLRFAASVVPDGAPRLYGLSERSHGFAMEFLDGDHVYLWKAALLDGRSRGEESSIIADRLGQVHAASSKAAFDRSPFENRDDFRALRIEPYLTFTAARHPGIAAPLHDFAEELYRASRALVHGDVSPKNILVRQGHPVLLDAECATMGDPAFDVAFCLNHLVLKAIHLPGSRKALLAAARAFWAAYRCHISFDSPSALEGRVARLLPMLMLARVDGKSPVEYLDPAEQACVRQLAVPLIRTPAGSLDEVIAAIDT